MTTQSRKLSRDEIEALGRELDELRTRVLADLGQRDIDHIRGVIRRSHQAELVGRGLLHVGIGPMTFVAGVASLAVSKILENMEIGHNVMHGQYDWARDPLLNGHAYDWDMGCATSDWHESHNFEHQHDDGEHAAFEAAQARACHDCCPSKVSLIRRLCVPMPHWKINARALAVSG